MSTSKFEFAKLVELLRRSENDPEVRNFFGQAMSRVERDGYYGSLEFEPVGVEVVFNEAPWIAPPEQVGDPKELYVSAFHLHRQGHDGYAGYSGQLPNGVVLDDSEDEVLRKMGPPHSSGGGSMSKVLKGPIPRWIRYTLGNAFLHFQLDPAGRVAMVTLDAREVKQGNLSPCR